MIRTKRGTAAYLALFIFVGVSLSCVNTQSLTTHPFSSITPGATSKIDSVKVSLKLIEPTSGNYYLWDSMLKGQKEKTLTWKDAKDLSPRELFFVKDGFGIPNRLFQIDIVSNIEKKQDQANQDVRENNKLRSQLMKKNKT